MSISIDELFDMLSWKSDLETQRRGIELAKDIKCHSVFMRPCGMEHGKDIWENCAKILYDCPDEILKWHSLELLRWIEDLNWPGAEIILKRLIAFSDTGWLASRIETSVRYALSCDKQGWLRNMSALLENKGLKDTLQKDIYEILYVRYKQII